MTELTMGFDLGIEDSKTAVCLSDGKNYFHGFEIILCTYKHHDYFTDEFRMMMNKIAITNGFCQKVELKEGECLLNKRNGKLFVGQKVFDNLMKGDLSANKTRKIESY